MVKFLLGIAIVAFTTFCGYVLAKKYRQRKLFFVQLSEFNERFLNEITYYRRPILEFATHYHYKGEFHFLLQDYFNNLTTERLPLTKIIEYAEYSFLKKEEKQLLVDYLQMLGKGDSVSQKNYFLSVKESLKKMQTETSENCKKYGDLYVKIGFLSGLLILILIL